MKSSQKSSVVSLLILFSLISSLLFPINALADDSTPPAEPTATATEAPVTAVPITETPAATEPPATEVPATEVPSTEVPATAVPASEPPPTEAAAIEEAAPESINLAEIVQDVAANDLTLTDANGDALEMASVDTVETITSGDPYIIRNGATIYFMSDCSTITVVPPDTCIESDTPIQSAIDHALPGETIVVLPGSIPYNEQLVINTANITLLGDPGIPNSPGAGPNAPTLDGTGLAPNFDSNGDGVLDTNIGITINAEGFSLIGFIIQNFDLAIYQPVISGSNTINILNNTIRDNGDGILVRKGTGSPGTVVQYNIFTGNDGFDLSNNPNSNNEQFLDARYNYWGCPSGPVVAYKIFRGKTWTGDWGYIDWTTKTDFGSNKTPPNPDPDCAVIYGHDPLYDFQINTGDYSPYKIILDPVGIPLCEDPEANNYGEPAPCDFSAPPAVNLSKTVDVHTLPEPGGDFTFTLTIVNNSTQAVTITALTDTNPLPAACTSLIGTVLAASDGTPGGTDEASCSYVVNHSEPGTYNNQAAVTVVNSAGAPASDNASQIVTVENLNPTVTLDKSATPASLPEPGGPFTFTLTITNTSIETVTITALSDDNQLSPQCQALINTSLAAGASTSCSYQVTHTETGSYPNTASVTVSDNENVTATATDSETVSVTNLVPTIAMTKTASPTHVPETGGNVTFTFVVTNNSVEAVTLTSLTDSVFGDLNGKGTCVTGGLIAAGGSYSCIYTVLLASDSLSSHNNTATAAATDNDGATAEASDSETVTFDNVAPAIRMTKTASPTHVAETGGNVSFTFLVENIGVEDVTLTTLNDTVFGDLNGKGTCVTGGLIAAGGSYSCTYTVFLASDSLMAHTNVVTAVGTDDDETTAEASDTETVTFDNVAPAIRMTKTASPTHVPETGGNVTFTFLVENIGQEDITLTALDDTIFGNLDGKGTCDVPQTILIGGSYSCTYTVFLASDSLTAHTNVVTATGHDDDGTPTSDDDTETVTFDNVAPAIRMTKTASPTHVPETGGNVTFTFLVENTGVEDVSLTNLTDSVFGDLNGKGTCATGGLIAAGSSYSCTYTVFLASDSLTAHTNVVTATAVDDDKTPATDDDDATVTFDDVAPAIRMTKTASPTHVPETGGNVTFTFLVENIGVEDITLTTLSDTVFGDLDGQGTCDIPQTILIGGSYSCTYTVFLASDSLAAHTNVVTATAVDDDNTPVTDVDDETVTFDNVAPAIRMTKTASPTHVAETGGNVSFTFLVENIGVEDVTLTALNDTIFGNLDGKGTCDVPQTILIGGSYSCTYTVSLASDSLTAHYNVVTATAVDDDNTPATATDDATVTFDGVAPDISITKTASPTHVPETGGNVTFTFLVENTGVEDITLTTLNDTIFGDLNGQGDCITGGLIPVGGSYSCSISVPLASDSLASHYNVVTAIGTDDDQQTDTATDSETVTFDDVGPSISITKTANTTHVPETGGAVTFTFVVTNDGTEDVTLTSLTDDVFGDLNGKGDCATGALIPTGSSYSCTYTAWLASDSLTAHTNVVTAVGTDNDGTPASDTDNETVTFDNVAPVIRITKTANPANLPESGGNVTFTFLVENIGPEDVTLTTLNDTVFGNLDGKGSCDVPQTILISGQYSCAYTLFLSSNTLTAHYNVVTAGAVDDDGTQASDTDDETVSFNDQPPSVTLDKTASPLTLPEHSTGFTYTLSIHNTSVETVTITTLTDSSALSAECLALIGTSIPAGGTVTCHYTVLRPEAGTYENIASVTVADNENNTASDTDDATVNVTDVLPSVKLTKEADVYVLYMPGGWFTFTLTVTNESVESVTITQLTDDNTLPAQCLALIGQTLAPGESKSCQYRVKHAQEGRYPNRADVTVQDNEGNPASDTDSKSVAVKYKTQDIPGIIPVTGGETHAIAAGIAHTCAITAEGGVQCWGNNNYGQLGNGSNKGSNIPVDVREVQGGTSIVAGGNHTCLLASNDVWCWGQNAQGQIGDGTTSDRNVPVKILSGAADITAGLNYSCAVMLNGQVMCWGDNDQGQLADGSKRDHTKPTLASLITGVSNIDAGQNKSCGLTETGLLRCVSSPAAATAAGLVPVSGALSEPSLDVAVDRFGSVILAIDEEGMPIVFQGSRITKIESIRDAIDVDSGYSHICALLNDGTVRCWGSNNFGQLGDNSGTNGQDPRQVVDLSSAWEIAVGKNHSCVLVESDIVGINEIKCWGLNTDGQLGNGSNQNSPVPVFVVKP